MPKKTASESSIRITAEENEQANQVEGDLYRFICKWNGMWKIFQMKENTKIYSSSTQMRYPTCCFVAVPSSSPCRFLFSHATSYTSPALYRNLDHLLVCLSRSFHAVLALLYLQPTVTHTSSFSLVKQECSMSGFNNIGY